MLNLIRGRFTAQILVAMGVAAKPLDCRVVVLGELDVHLVEFSHTALIRLRVTLLKLTVHLDELVELQLEVGAVFSVLEWQQ